MSSAFGEARLVKNTLDAEIAAAVERRTALPQSANAALRLFHGQADGVPGLVIEKFGPVLIAQLHDGQLQADESDVRNACERLCTQLGARAVYQKVFPTDRNTALRQLEKLHNDPQPWIGQPVEPEFSIVENGVRFLIRPYDGYSVGLFLEHRDSRRRVRESSAGKRVLNLFAYTCGFSVAAALGGAAATDNVDASKKYLEWGKRNFAANRLALDSHRFFCDDVFSFLRRAKRQERFYDLAVVDPPTFGRQKDAPRPFALTEDLDRLVAETVDRLSPGGVMLIAVNHRPTTLARLENTIRRATAGRKCEILDRPSLPVDFAGDPAFSKTVIARLA
ncbi:Ribosomal RNA large subunit methyltransferase K [Phycisphaerae bacterium RAS1]|nr:Ribosomal RNA large subunit methyltransferase K [Phycisphaerae bacterium RAS1]